MNRNLILADDFDAPDEPFKPALPHERRIRVNSVKTLTRCYVCVTDEYEFLRSRCPRSTLTTRICACIGGEISHIVMINGLLFKAVQIAALAGEWEPSEVMCFNITGITWLACNWSRSRRITRTSNKNCLSHPCRHSGSSKFHPRRNWERRMSNRRDWKSGLLRTLGRVDCF